MQDFFYSIIGIAGILIQLIINGSVMFRKAKSDAVSRYYRSFAISVLAYYITDACWGLFAGLKWTTALFIDTTVYFFAMGSIVVWWYCYIVEYLGKEGRVERFFKTAGLVFVALEIIFLVMNLFVPVFFWFDETGAYVTGTLRYVMLWVQIVMAR